MNENENTLKITELKNAVYFLSEQLEKNRATQKTAFEELSKRVEKADFLNIEKLTSEYSRKTDLLVATIGSLIGKLENTERNIHVLQVKELHEMNNLLLKVLTQIRDNQHLTAHTISNLAKHVALQNKKMKTKRIKPKKFTRNK